MSKGTVGIIGAGVSGLTAARYLTGQGFETTNFEVHSSLGGQWNRTNPNSGVWSEMRTNTAKFVTKLSDVQYPENVAMFPRNGEVLDMLQAFADENRLNERIRLNADVTRVERDGAGYRVHWNSGNEASQARFDRVVIASGRFNKPEIPNIAGLDTFSGDAGVIHAFRYKDPERYRGKNVVICGGSISALEIASDLAMLGAKRVYLAQRRQRYVMPKMVAGTPLEYFAFTREGALALATTPTDRLLADTKAFLLKLGGDPARYGAPSPHEDMAKAGVTGSQHYLNLVAEDRIDVRPWIDSVDGKTVNFTDGNSVEADAIIIGTGFDLNLPFLTGDIAEAVKLTRKSIDLFEFTFHPDLDGLAFMGLWAQLGPYPVVLEQQARFIAYTWGGLRPMPARERLIEGVADCVSDGHHVGYRQQHEMAIRFARLSGTDPRDTQDPVLREILPKSAVTGEMFRIVGPDALPNAATRLIQDFWTYAPPEVRQDVLGALDRSPMRVGIATLT